MQRNTTDETTKPKDMHSHLDIKVNGKSLVIPEDSSLSVEEKNPMFNDVTFFSYPMQIPVEGNREVLKNIAHRDSNMRAMDLEHADARIFADGLPLNHGQVITQDGSEIKDTFEFNIDAQQQSLSELIGEMECRDVKIKDDILIGEKIGRVLVNYNVNAKDYLRCYESHNPFIPPILVSERTIREYSDAGSKIIESPQALGFSFYGRTQGFPVAEKDEDGNIKVTEGFINVSQPYPFPYCNARVAYAHPDVKRNDDGTLETDGIVQGNDKGSDPRDFGQYWCLGADRQQSGICFYVLYFLDCLFAQLGVAFDKSELLEVEDLKRLAFFTTLCKYDEREIRNEQWPNGKVLANGEIQQWLDSRGCGGKLDIFLYAGKTKVPLPSFGLPFIRELDNEYPTDEYGNLHADDWYYSITASAGGLYTNQFSRILDATVTATTEIYEMYANSENFPNASVSSVISSLEASFGIRFLYDPEKKTVTARLLRNIYKNKKVNQFRAKVLDMLPLNEKITGVRMSYSEESDAKEQRDNVRYGVKDYNTEYDYIDYPEDRTILDLEYQDILSHVISTNMNVYVDKKTGNSYRVKVAEEATDTLNRRPVLFQVAQNKGIEVGDCSEKNKDYVRELTSNFAPLSLNVINAKEYNNDKTGGESPILAPLLDVEMEHEYLEQRIQSVAHEIPTPPNQGPMGASFSNMAFPNGIQIILRERLNIPESYDPTQTDSGNSPLQDIDWGLTIAVMRGGGNAAEIINYDEGYDGFGNFRWKDTVATYEMTSDSMDLKGAIFDYNGTEGGDGGGERFSLAIRSWAQFVYYKDVGGKLHINKDVSLAGQPVEGVSGKTWLIPCDDDERDQHGNIVNKIRSRGLFDTFMREHVHALLHRKPYKIPVQATIAQLLDIRNHWSEKYVIDGKVGWINAIKYNIEKANGITDAEIEFYSL